MPLQTDFATGLGSPEDWWFEGAVSKIAAVASNDGDSSCVYADTGGALKTIQFTFPLLAGVVDPVNTAGISTVCRVQRWGGGGQEFYHVWNGATAGSNRASVLSASAYVQFSYDAVAPTVAAVNGQHGMQVRAAGGPSNKFEVWCSYLYRYVDFTYLASGGGTQQENNFAHLASAIVGAIGAGLLLREMPALARSVWRRTGTLILPREYETALREIAAMKRPVTV